MSRSKGKLAKRLTRLENQQRKDMIRLRREVFRYVNQSLDGHEHAWHHLSIARELADGE